jgi:uncharacterized protein
MRLPFAAAVWAAVVVFTAILGNRLGYTGARFGVALLVASVLFAFELFLAAPSVLEKVHALFGGRTGTVVPLVPLIAILAYSFCVTGDWQLGVIGAAYAVLPALLVARSVGKPPGTWEDYAAALLIWLPVEFRWMYRIFPYPHELTHTLTILMALGTGVAAFVVLRRMDGVGYAVEWRRGFGWNVAVHFIVFVCIAVPLGIEIGFLSFDPTLARLHPLSALGVAVGITLFTAWPEEFLFRGILQNLLSRSLKNRWAGLAVASVIFGLSHILHAPYPNWKYVLLATIAGLFYGHTWMRTGSLLPGALVHALVDISWHVAFR